MISIQLDSLQQQRLDELARSEGQSGAELARRILLDYLDFHQLPNDSEHNWAQASVALTPEILREETWE